MTLNYIGSKYKLIDEIIPIINKYINIKDSVVGDLFSGTSICGRKFREQGAKKVISNDLEYYSFVLSKALVNEVFTSEKEKELERLNKVQAVDGLVYNNYSKAGRMFFTDENARKIDGIRMNIKEGDYYSLACLILAADKVANTASVYGSYLKKFKSSALKDIVLIPIHKLSNKVENVIYQKDALEIQDSMDIAYLDVPYNHRQYSKNYHVLNYIAEYKERALRGTAGLFEGANLSAFCSKREVKKTFDSLIKNLNAKWIFISYNDEGLLGQENLTEILETYGTVHIEKIDYKRFQSKKGMKKDTVEYLFVVHKP